ncbi:hypothetical protein HYV22_04615 [Candidatus Gottesmanbacteria bacterium]|nr:hypothetical protein [Candidatus Gottesmanbacteria bacterium]
MTTIEERLRAALLAVATGDYDHLNPGSCGYDGCNCAERYAATALCEIVGHVEDGGVPARDYETKDMLYFCECCGIVMRREKERK